MGNTYPKLSPIALTSQSKAIIDTRAILASMPLVQLPEVNSNYILVLREAIDDQIAAWNIMPDNDATRAAHAQFAAEQVAAGMPAPSWEEYRFKTATQKAFAKCHTEHTGPDGKRVWTINKTAARKFFAEVADLQALGQVLRAEEARINEALEKYYESAEVAG